MSFDTFVTLVRSRFPGIGDAQLKQFQQLPALYAAWNEKINVVSRKDMDALYEHHVLHSLAIAAWLQTRPELEAAFREGKILDLGTGGGFPGIPLAILYPEASFLLCDSIGKKVTVAREIASSLGLAHAEAVQARAETLEGPFDFVVTRAVATLTDLYPWVRGKYRHGLIALKGGLSLPEEIAEYTRKYKKGAVSTWPAGSWLTDPYYSEKYVVYCGI